MLWIGTQIAIEVWSAFLLIQLRERNQIDRRGSMQRGWTKVMYIIFMKNISKVAPMAPSSFVKLTLHFEFYPSKFLQFSWLVRVPCEEIDAIPHICFIYNFPSRFE